MKSISNRFAVALLSGAALVGCSDEYNEFDGMVNTASAECSSGSQKLDKENCANLLNAQAGRLAEIAGLKPTFEKEAFLSDPESLRGQLAVSQARRNLESVAKISTNQDVGTTIAKITANLAQAGM